MRIFIKMAIFPIIAIIILWSTIVDASAKNIIQADKNIDDNKYYISANNVETFLKPFFIKEGLEENIEIEIKSHDKIIGFAGEEDKYEVKLQELDINRRSNRFAASLNFIGKQLQFPIQIAGIYREFMLAPVPAYRIPSDTTIEEEDIIFIDIDKRRVRSDTILDADELIGKSAQRTVAAHTLMRNKDIKRQSIIEKMDTVNVVYKTPAMYLQTVGIAMDEGAKGDTIRVRNPSSNKIIQAIIHDYNTATALINTINQ